jgi:putative transposase
LLFFFLLSPDFCLSKKPTRVSRVPDRHCADAIFYVLRTGGPWQALDQTELSAHSTAHDRYQEWVEAGVFLNLWQAGVEQYDELCGIDWDWLSMDGAIRHPPRWAGNKTRPNPTERGKSGVKRSLRTFWHGVRSGVTIEGAQRHDMKLVRPTIESIVVERPKPTNYLALLHFVCGLIAFRAAGLFG